MTGNTMTLNIHCGSHTSGQITVDHATGQIVQNFTHDPNAAKGVGYPMP
jgi:hypothetical protein